eukprot:CAMPEP_0206003898 /NCGR_PEP_ID=MMETSP1464-20131121/3657_1 /ASSEMBLY_ACC=CAM_ASM_001124 /TAXON_ID=119497 /ORGANISM="Exanthemachrysis gayraliae, Strain RCC1523" /LENGTH=408 /DNA_ID=CAMNT_0053377291 /DNA_START=13 /DNA_END=1241 /DNA_ORIENTATION=-
MSAHDATLVFASAAVGAAVTGLFALHWSRRERATMQPKKSFHIVGDVYLDMIAKVSSLPRYNSDTLIEKKIETQPGGSALNTAVQLESLIRTRRRDYTHRQMRFDRCVLHSLVGDDLYGRMVADRVRKTGVILSAPSAGGQGVCVCLSGPTDRAFVSYRGTVERFCERDIDRSLLLSRNTGHVHFAAYYECTGLQPAMAKLMSAARACGATVSLVPQSDQMGEWNAKLLETVHLLDVLICNEEEATAMTHRPVGDLEGAIQVVLDRNCPLIVITRGAEGAIAATREQRWTQRARARQVVDTTGAGDAFAAGFLYGWCQARDVALGLQFGCACGAAAVGQMGGSHPIDADEINQCMSAVDRAKGRREQCAPAARLAAGWLSGRARPEQGQGAAGGSHSAVAKMNRLRYV